MHPFEETSKPNLILHVSLSPMLMHRICSLHVDFGARIYFCQSVVMYTGTGQGTREEDFIGTNGKFLWTTRGI